ncbi:MAG: hypothetical protein Q8L85_10180 [Alphaproteobacteria bacterium]|nr:hypothetical protein [Alphaproteobacteria bacterium]
MKLIQFIRHSILQVAIFSITIQASFANDITLNLLDEETSQLIQEYVPINLTWDFLRQLSKTKCTGLDDTQNSIKQNGIEYTGNSEDIQKARPYFNMFSYPRLINAIFNPNDQTFDLTYEYHYPGYGDYSFVIRAKPSADKAQEFKTKLGNFDQQAPEKLDGFISLEDTLDNSSYQSSSSADPSLLAANDFDGLSHANKMHHPIIIQNDSDYPVVIINGFSPLRCVAPHSTIVEHISDESNFRMYRINPASTILNVIGTATAATAVGTIASTLMVGTCMLVSAPLSIPIITGISIIGGASWTVCKWKNATKDRYPVTRQVLDPSQIDSQSIAKITIFNAEDASTIDSTFELLNAKELMNTLSLSFSTKMVEYIKSNLQNNQLIESFNQRFAELTRNFNNDLEFNTKVANLLFLVQELENAINPPEEKSIIAKIIHWATNPENRDAVITLVKAVK